MKGSRCIARLFVPIYQSIGEGRGAGGLIQWWVATEGQQINFVTGVVWFYF